MQIGALLEELTVAKARAGIEKLVHLTPQTARIIAVNKESWKQTDNEEGELTAAEQVDIGNILRVLPGETILAAGAEGTSEHPLGKAIVNSYRVQVNHTIYRAEDFQMIPGQGVRARIQGKTILAGNETMMRAAFVWQIWNGRKPL